MSKTGTLTPGQTLGRYEIAAFLAAGGMGEVYRAVDTRLNRVVAIKRLTGPRSDRFQEEAHAIAALNPPHICQIYDVGADYLVLEYIDGQPTAGAGVRGHRPASGDANRERPRSRPRPGDISR